MKHLSLLTIALCALVSTTFSQYSLTVESAPAVDPALGTTYRFYVDLQDPTDRVSAVFGNNNGTLAINAPEGVYNNELYNASWSASGINSAFFDLVPELAADTYATIGLDGPASTSGIVGAADPSIVEDADQPITPFFQTNGATSLSVNSQIGGSWYILNTAANGLAQDGDLRVLVLQVTSTGPVTGQINYQVFPLGVGDDQVINLTSFEGAGTWDAEIFISIPGCTDETACNFNPEANLPQVDGCAFPDECGNCDGEETGPGIPEGACDCEGNVEDACGVCGGDNSTCEGCALTVACNYDPSVPLEANNTLLCVVPNGNCDCATDTLGVNTGLLEGDMDGDGVCDNIDACTDVTACNYDADPSEPCAVEDECGVCGGNGIPEGDCDCNGNQLDALDVCGGSCAADIDMDDICDDVDSCTDTTACNYDADPTESCLYLDALDLCGGTCFEADTVNGGCLEEIVLGCLDTLACNYNMDANTDDGSCLQLDVCGICGGDGIPAGDCDCDGNQFDALGDCGGTCFEADTVNGGCLVEIMLGCTDTLACNYNMDANTDDGSCLIIGESCDDMDENTVNDIINDACVCAGDVPGCTDSTACNYDDTATIDDGSCEFDSCAGCTNADACNYDDTATIDDGSCLITGESCDDGDATTINDVIDADCECNGETDGIEEAAMLAFGMFPNPTTGEVTLTLSGFHNGVTIQVMDGAGRVVWSQQNLALQGNTVIDLSSLSAGSYNVMLSDERGISVNRLVIQK